MADEAVTSIGFDARKAKQGADEFDAAGNKIIAKNAEVEASEEKLASKVEATSGRKSRARKAEALTGAEAAAKTIADAAALDSVLTRTTDKQVEDLRKRDRALAAAARAYDPLGSALRKVEGDISRLSGIIEKGNLTDQQMAQAKASLAGAILKQADAQRAVNAAMLAQPSAGARSGGQDDLAASVQRYRDKLQPALLLQRSFYENIARINAAAAAPGGISSTQRTDLIKAESDEFARKTKILTGVAEKEREAAAATEAYQRQISALKVAIDPLAEEQRKYSEAVTFANKAEAAGDITDKQRLAAHALAATTLDRNVDALKKHAQATQASTAASRQMQFALTNLSFQANDVISSLGAGISLQQTAFQQFGQIFQIGQQVGFKNLLTNVKDGLLALITPFRLAVAGSLALGAGFTALLVRGANTAEQLRQFNLILQQTGKDSLTTAEDAQRTVRELQKLGVSRDDARSATSAILRNPSLNPAQQTRIATTGVDVAARFGIKDVEGISKWTGAIEGGVDSLIKLGFQMDALSLPQAKLARDMARNGQSLEATNQLIDTISKKIAGSGNDMKTGFEKALNEMSNAWGEFIDKLGNSNGMQRVLKLLENNFKDWADIVSGNFRSVAERNGLVSPQPTGLAVDWRAQRNSAIPGGQNYPGSPANVAATPVVTKAFSATANAPLVNVDPDLVATFEQALIESGMRAIITSSSGGSHAFGSQHYARNTITGKGEALDYNLLDASGNPILHRDAHTPGTAAYDAYVKFGEAFKKLSPGKGRSGMDFSQIDPGHVDFGLLSGAPAGAGASSNQAVRSKEQTDALQKSYDALSESTADATRNAKFYGVVQQANTQQTQVFRQALAEGATQDEAKSRAQIAYNSALAIGAIELQKTIGIENDRIAGLGKETTALHTSAAAGYRAAAAAEAEIEVKQRGIGSVSETTERKLREGAASAIRDSARQAAAAQPQLVALDKLAAATLKGTAAAHEQELQNEAVLRTQDALEKADATGIPTLIAKAKAEQDLALAQSRRADTQRQATAAAAAANDNKLALQSISLETGLTRSGATSSEIQRQLDYLTIIQTLDTKYKNANLSEEGRAARDAYLQTGVAIADAKVALTEAQREQEKWNDLVRGLANTIENELTKSIENAFDPEKVETWGKRIQRWLGTATSSLSSSLFIKPALGTAAGALGFGTVASGLGSFGDLLGTGTSSTSASGSGGPSVTKNTDGSVTLKNFESTASLSKSLFGDSGGTSWFSNLGSKLGFATTSPGLTDSQFAMLGLEGGKGVLGESSTISGSLFGSTTLGSAFGGIGAGFGAGTLLNSLLGGNKTTGTGGSAVGSLAGAAIGSIIPGVGTLIGGLVGGAAGGGLGGLFGQTHKRANASGLSIDLATGDVSGFTSGGSKENDRSVREIRDSLTDFTKEIQSTTKGVVSGFINPQVTDQGTKLDYSIPGFGSGTYDAEDAQDAVDKAELAIARGLTGISDAMKTVIDQITDPADLDAAIKFAETYDKIADAAKDAFSSIPSDLNVDGPFTKARDDIKDTFDAIADDAEKFGLSLQPITDALDEANKRLTKDFNRYIGDLATAIDDPLQSLVDIAKRNGDALVRDAEAVGGDVIAVNKYNAKVLDGIWKDSTASLKDYAEELRSGDLSGLTAYQRLGPANDNYKSLLADVQSGKSSDFDKLLTSAKNVFSLSTDSYGQGPKTAGLRTDILTAIDGVMASRSFAAGGTTLPGWNRVGEQGEEWLYLPTPATVLPHGQMPTSGRDSGEMAGLLRELLAEMRANTGTARQGHYETGKKLDGVASEMKQAPLYEPTRRKVA